MKKFDNLFFFRRYGLIENDFLELTDFIEPEHDFNSPCYKFGSSKLMDFCLKVGTEIETLLKIFLENNKFDSLPDIENKRKYQNINIYREVLEPKYHFNKDKLFVYHIKKEIHPFENFDNKTPIWFKIYSKYKHDKLELIKKWNLEYAIYSLGALLLLVLNHPDTDHQKFFVNDFESKVFNLAGSRPKFASECINIPAKDIENIAIGDRIEIKKNDTNEFIVKNR